jgi:hypothetical protein
VNVWLPMVGGAPLVGKGPPLHGRWHEAASEIATWIAANSVITFGHHSCPPGIVILLVPFPWTLRSEAPLHH